MIYLLHHAIEQSARHHPDGEAFRFREAALTYRDCARRIEQLATQLQLFGVRPFDRVGILMPKCLELGVAVHGVLRAGAIFVPIDPAAPIERISFILRDCGIRHLVTHPSRRRTIHELDHAGAELLGVVGLTTDTTSPSNLRSCSWDDVLRIEPRPPDLRLTARDPAYVMYTSGSTGTPKGLTHTHQSGLAYASLAVETYGVRPGDRLGNHSPLHFDMSTFEYFAGPLAGATTVIIPDDTKMFPVALAQLVARERLTFWYSVPLALIQMLERGNLEACDWSQLRWILFGGEPFPPHHLRALMRHCPQARFSNVYGPAEVNQCTYFHLDEHASLPDDEPIPLGTVWPNTDALILDANGQPVSEGDIGELLIHSATMMRGYWRRPDLDQTAFHEVAIAPGVARRYYRTGDLVRRNDDGNLIFVGRKDRQIKIRGYRLELDEVEAVVASHPGVAEAAVVAVRERDLLPSKVVAFVRIRSGNKASAESLRQHARERLPIYGVPSEFVSLCDFPRTGTGKTDRKALAQCHLAATTAPTESITDPIRPTC